MSKQVKTRAVTRNRFEQAVATETLPGETPAIFSNEGFCARIQEPLQPGSIEKFIIDTIVINENKKRPYTKPHKYRIRKSTYDFRRLSLIHPHSQYKAAQFLRDYSGHICYFCSRSSFSIRHPKKVAKTVYIRKSNSKKNSSMHKSEAVSAASQFAYFAYGGYDRLYRFFNSRRFVRLESKYPELLKLDVTKCFDSIYTHSIAWATRDKLYSKANVSVRTFGNDFDTLMQKSNFNETNGIPIGPELSRVFAEIIFQEVDQLTKARLAEHGKLEGIDYEAARYVDDIFIFARDASVANFVFECYVEFLSEYNLHVNTSKVESFKRPFFTKKSKVIRDTNQCINSFIESFLKYAPDRSKLVPLKIHRPDRHIRSFVDAIKSACAQNQVSYDDVTPYIVSALLQRTKLLIEGDSEEVASARDEYYFACRALLESSFFFYTVSPAVSSSYHLCETIIEICKFTSENLPKDILSIRQLIHEKCALLLDSDWAESRPEITDFVFLEAINVALATCAHGPDFSLPKATLERILPVNSSSDYFQIVCAIFYCRDRPEYAEILKKAIKEVDERLLELTKIESDSQLAHLFLDSISCPFISQKTRRKWIGRLYKSQSTPIPPTADLNAYLVQSESKPWFVNWSEENLLSQLAKKRLLQAYA
ncbi:RNA-directed DNA polymerase [Stenotrophomonas maltophilia]|nr:RNA-directed DNA polymerase [Stenotrophomonas maltophilia]MBH1845966.1 RNA-directed DNA polymerase [Stenotrophomonas maltophilia]